MFVTFTFPTTEDGSFLGCAKCKKLLNWVFIKGRVLGFLADSQELGKSLV